MFYDVVSVEESWEQWMARRSAVRDRIGKTMGEEPFPEWRVTAVSYTHLRAHETD